MNYDQYRGRTCTIKSTGVKGTIENVRNKRGGENRLASRFIVIDEKGKEYELMPHEVKIDMV